MSKKIALVTGAAGFIGSNMTDFLLKKGYKVRAIDNLSVGSKKNFTHNLKNKNFKFKKIDLLKINQGETFFKKIDYVFHFAGLTEVIPSFNNPQKYIYNNFIGTIKLLEAVRKEKINKFVYAASASCYGVTSKKVKETDLIRNEHPYALSKYLGEMATLHWQKVFGLPINSMRIFNAYGLRNKSKGAYSSVIGIFLRQRKEKKPLTIVGNGNQTRDFVNVKDVCEAFLKAATSKFSGRIYNIGTSKCLKINKVAGFISNKKTKLPQRKNEALNSNSDISRIKRELNWYPKILFKEGIKDLL